MEFIALSRTLLKPSFLENSTNQKASIEMWFFPMLVITSFQKTTLPSHLRDQEMLQSLVSVSLIQFWTSTVPLTITELFPVWTKDHNQVKTLLGILETLMVLPQRIRLFRRTLTNQLIMYVLKRDPSDDGTSTATTYQEQLGLFSRIQNSVFSNRKMQLKTAYKPNYYRYNVCC